MNKAFIFVSLLISFLLLLVPIKKAGAVKYTYDALNRLTSTSYANGQTIIYTYDAAGNVVKTTVTQCPPDTEVVTPPNTQTNAAPIIPVSQEITESITESSTVCQPSSPWQVVGTTGFLSCSCGFSFFVDQGIPYVANSDKVMKFANGSWQYVGGNYSSGVAQYRSLFVDRGIPYVAFRDNSDTLYNATVVKFVDGAWQTVGKRGFSSPAGAQDLSLFVDQGTPYVAFTDFRYTPKVMKYDSGSWKDLGDPGFAKDNTWDIALFVDSGTPYVAFTVSKNGSLNIGQIVVEKYDPKLGWQMLGQSDVSGNVSLKSLFVYQGTPYVAYQVMGSKGKAQVMACNSAAGWHSVGNSISGASEISLYINQGTPYVAYSDESHGHGATVMKYTDGKWQTIGQPGFSEGWVGLPKIYFDRGNPYVAYLDGAHHVNVTVAKHLQSALFVVGDSSYYLDGKQVPMDASPFISDDRALVPVFYLAEVLGAMTTWDETAGKVTIAKDGKVVILTIGSPYLSVGGVTEKIDTTPVILNGRTYLPARFVAEALGFPVSWDKTSQAVIVTLSKQKIEN